MTIETLAVRDEHTVGYLTALWRESVRATHDFLPEAQADGFIRPVKKLIARIETLLVARNGRGEITGFLGAQKGNVDMLFVAPGHFGRGTGTALMRRAIDDLGCTRVDVNEDNARAFEFYTKMGFRVASRDELDGQGNPYPILHLEL